MHTTPQHHTPPAFSSTTTYCESRSTPLHPALHLRWAVSPAAARACCDLGFLIVCASSRTTRSHSTPRSPERAPPCGGGEGGTRQYRVRDGSSGGLAAMHRQAFADEEYGIQQREVHRNPPSSFGCALFHLHSSHGEPTPPQPPAPHKGQSYFKKIQPPDQPTQPPITLPPNSSNPP